MSFNILAALASLIAGIIYFIPGEMMYRSLRGVLPGPVLMAIYFFGLALCVFVVIFILSKLLGNYRHLHNTFGKTIMVILLLTCIGVPLVSAGTEFLYELGKSDIHKPKNYIFLMDNSASMSDNDPNGMRKNVVEDVANSLPDDINVGIYTFSTDTHAVYEVGTAIPGSISIPDSAVEAEGNTSLYNCIMTVANDMPSDMLKSASKFFVLTDGNPTDKNLYGKAVKVCNENDFAVSCIGFGHYSQSTFIDLANRTGGNFMAADDVSQLKMSVTEIINKNPVNRDLISSRNDRTTNSKLYAVLRVLFLIMIGMVFAYLKYLNAALSTFSLPFFVACLVSALIGGIFVELFYKLYWVESVGRFVLCLTFAFTPLLSNSYYTNMSGSSIRDSYANSNNSYTNNFPY